MFASISNVFDVVVSNPPYIETDVCKTLDEEVLKYDPILALDGGLDGLDFYRAIAKNAANYLEDGGILIMEFGIGQANDIASLLKDNFTEIEIKKDLSGLERIIKAKKKVINNL